MASNRIEGGLKALGDAGFFILQRRVDQKMKITKSLRTGRAQIENGLSLGGFRGGIRALKSKSKTDLRALVRGVMLAHHVMKDTPLTDLKRTYKDKSEVELKAALRLLDTASGGGVGSGPTKRSTDGRHHYIFDQTKGSSCGPACVRMVVKQVLNKMVGEEQIRQQIERHEGGTVSKLTSETSAFTPGSHDWGMHGAKGSGRGGFGTWDVGAALKAMKIKCEELPDGNVRNRLQRTTYKKPGIAVVKWATGGLHWVVVAGRVGGAKVLVLDPACGLFEIDPNVAQPQYTDAHGTVGKFTGRMVLVTGQA